MKTRLMLCACIVPAIFITSLAEAKLPQKISDEIANTFKVAEPHHGLDTAYVPPDPSKLRGAVVILRGGIPAEKARYFISWDEYDYRGAVVHAEKNSPQSADGASGELTTRRGAIYTYLQPGDPMIVVGIKDFSGTVYLKLLSPDVYVPDNRRSEKRHSRVTVMLGFKLPKELVSKDDAEGVLKLIGEWIKPFQAVDSAKAYAMTMKGGKEEEAASVPAKASKKGKAAKRGEGGSQPADAKAPDAPIDDAKIKNLEDKIDAAKRQMEEAEAEMKRLREENNKTK